ncbi:hypothetical protein K469DRAFT_682475 [Zopfia rhizophila CBS 207.26]|uniref:Uncharacterized protein n=1 Tax=Zopfia rhizophila CBS 207.26 TaxID=1314779 RepID=A0A6A6DBF2_9PEZI|nr:hypothetical protein K469DRAFT_682475 [Zopfia rhizophila CBS 207.26]
MDGEQHRIIVEGFEEPWTNSVHRGRLQRYSRGLSRLVDIDAQQGRREAYIEVPSILVPNVVTILITWINRGVPSCQPLNFKELLRLSRAIWHYKCDPDLFARLAASRQDAIRPQDQLGKRAAGWTFITLVFGWRESFQFASAQLLAEFASTINVIEGVRYFPSALTSTVAENRLQLLRGTFSFIKNTVFKLVNTPPFDRIAQLLRDKGIDVTLNENEYAPDTRGNNRDAQTENEAYQCPRTLLDIFENILLDRPKEGQPMEQFSNRSSAHTSSGSPSGRKTRLSSVDNSESRSMRTHRGNSAGNEVSIRKTLSGYWSRKKTSMPNRKSCQFWGRIDIYYFEVADELRIGIDEFKQANFLGLDINDFSYLRRDRVLLPQTGALQNG